MGNMQDALQRIKKLECPTAELTNRIKGILTEHEMINNSQITVSREGSLDRNGARGYRTKISYDNGQNIEILAMSGKDDYVVKVIDAYDCSNEGR